MQYTNKLAARISICKRCEFYKTAHRPVPGIGSLNADFMLVGEAPGTTEDQQGEPFVGAAGQLLRQILRENHYNLKNTYITNVVKHRPPNSRTPVKADVVICGNKFLLEEIALVRPKVIVALGRTASNALHWLAGETPPKGSHRGRTFYLTLGTKQYPVVAIWHPAAELYERKGIKKREIDEDLSRIAFLYGEK